MLLALAGLHNLFQPLARTGSQVFFTLLVLAFSLNASHADEGDKCTPPSVNGTAADVWLFTGQSNAQGWSLLKAPVESDPRIFFFREPVWPNVGQKAAPGARPRWVPAAEPLNTMFHTWTPGPWEMNILLQRTGVQVPEGFDLKQFIHSLHREKTPWGGVGPMVMFAKHLLKHQDRPIALINCAVGGTPIFAWDPERQKQGGGQLYSAMMKTVARAGGKIKGVVYVQGETDAMTHPPQWPTYEESLLHLIDALRRDTGNPDLPFIYGQIARLAHPYPLPENAWEKVREAQRRVMSRRKHVYMVGTLDLPLEDSCHMSFEGYQRLSQRLAEVALTKVYHRDGHAQPITLGSIEVLQPANSRPMIRVHFNGVTGRLRAAGRPTGFELRPATPPAHPDEYFTNQKNWRDPIHVVYRVDFDPEDPAGLILGVFDNSKLLQKPNALTEPVTLVYGPGADPYVNIVDEKGMAVPGFGPVAVPADNPHGRRGGSKPLEHGEQLQAPVQAGGQAAGGAITIVRDIAYREGPSKHWRLDLAMPKEVTGKPRPGIVVIHGGGWLAGDKSSFVFQDRAAPANIVDFAKLGFVAVSVNYRLSTEAPFPAALEDCKCAVRWLRAHAREYHLDRGHIGAWGNSAGGHLALLLAMVGRDAGLEGDGPYQEESSLVQAAVSDSGPIDLVRQALDSQVSGVVQRFLGGAPDGKRALSYQRASPISYVRRETPPLLLIYGVADLQVPVVTADEFVLALGKAGAADVTYHRLAYVDHCPHSLVAVPEMQEAVNAFFVRTLLHPESAKVVRRWKR